MELDATSLVAVERRVLERLVADLEEAYAGRLQAVWLYGSCARGERRREFSDVDVLVILDVATPEGQRDVDSRVWDHAVAEDADPPMYSVRVRDLAWLAGRREIRSFFVMEVERDRVILSGTAL